MREFLNDGEKRSAVDDLDALQGNLLQFIAMYSELRELDPEETQFVNNCETLVDTIESLAFHYVNEC